MPIDYSKYPDNWKQISERIRFERAGNKCEWCGAENYKSHPVTGSKVVLTVAHLGVDKPDGTPGDKSDLRDVREENLASLCQRCHLRYDAKDHAKKAAVTRAQNAREAIRESGQMEMFWEHGVKAISLFSGIDKRTGEDKTRGGQ